MFTAENGVEGAELIERIQPGSGARRSRAAGHERLRSRAAHPPERRQRRRSRLVALSGYGQDSDVQAALAAGFDEHLTKPPDPDRLERLLRGAGDE